MPGWLHGEGDVCAEYQRVRGFLGRQGLSGQGKSMGKGPEDMPALHLTNSAEKILSSHVGPLQNWHLLGHVRELQRPTSLCLCPTLTLPVLDVGDLGGRGGALPNGLQHGTV